MADTIYQGLQYALVEGLLSGAPDIRLDAVHGFVHRGGRRGRRQHGGHHHRSTSSMAWDTRRSIVPMSPSRTTRAPTSTG